MTRPRVSLFWVCGDNKRTQMEPAVWGPTCWKVMFAAAFRLPTPRMLDLLRALRHLLPCVHCRSSYCMYLDMLPPHLGIDAATPRSAAKFCWTIKDRVNLKVGYKALPFSAVCAKFEVFSQPFSRMDVVDLLCCMAVQVDADEQVAAYATFAAVARDLCAAHGERVELFLPLDAAYRSPPTLWLHALKCKNALCTELGQRTLSRDEALNVYRRDAPKAATATRTRRRTARGIRGQAPL